MIHKIDMQVVEKPGEFMFYEGQVEPCAVKGNKLLVLCKLFYCLIKVNAFDICFCFFPVIDTDYSYAVRLGGKACCFYVYKCRFFFKLLVCSPVMAWQKPPCKKKRGFYLIAVQLILQLLNITTAAFFSLLLVFHDL